MAWHQFTVTTDEHTAPRLAKFFEKSGAVSVTYADAEDQPVYEPALNKTVIWQRTQVIALFELDEIEPAELEAQTHSRYAKRIQHWQYDHIEDQAWERAWLEHFQPMKFADRLWICPTGMEQHEDGTVCMTLDPGLAFGTGTHPTTAMCLEWLASHDVSGKTVIDYGCGSGILAVAALLLGAEYAHGVDIDPQALTASQYNAEKNQVENRISYYLPEDFPPMQADVVLANILANPLIELAPTITALVKPGGALILSGILNEQADAVADAYRQQGLIVEPPVIQGDWCRLDAQKTAE